MTSTNTTASAALVPLDGLRKVLADDPKAGIFARLIAAGRIAAPDAEGRVDITTALPLFFEEMRSQMRAGTATAASERARQARAAAAELRVAESTRDLIPSEDAELAVDHLCGAVMTAITAMPARITRDVPTRRRIEAAFHTLQAAMAREIANT